MVNQSVTSSCPSPGLLCCVVPYKSQALRGSKAPRHSKRHIAETSRSHHGRDEFQRAVPQGHLREERKISELNLFSEFVRLKTFVFSSLCTCRAAEDLSMPWSVQQVPAHRDMEDEAGIGSGEVYFSSISSEISWNHRTIGWKRPLRSWSPTISRYLHHDCRSEISCVRLKQ